MSKTATKKAKGNELTTIVDLNRIQNLSFDNIYNIDEKELSKQNSYNQKKIGKMGQLKAKLIDMQNRIAKCEQQFIVSLTDPTLDSVELRIQIECYQKEKEIATSLLKSLFPEEFA